MSALSSARPGGARCAGRGRARSPRANARYTRRVVGARGQLLTHERHATDGAHAFYRSVGFTAEAEGFRLYLPPEPPAPGTP